MTPEAPTSLTQPAAIDELVRRARSLYSLPAVAAEVIQLTNNPKVDARALKECIQADPALTAKLLRVVNSSLFGLSREVCDLNQALALLGTKPLKLLVLGFSLPENLFQEVAREQLDWYWSTTLTRAVAAKEISEQLFNRPGDDAFLAGLFQDIGVLVLLGELKEPYANFLSGVIDQKVDLQRLEVDSLGFDHLQLTAALLEHWSMPKLLVDAISVPRNMAQLAKNDSEHITLAKVVHLAELVSELVGRNRLSVLPELMEVGAAYCKLEKRKLNDLVETLQPKVKQLAEVLSLELTTETDYVEIITAAHQQMSELAEEVTLRMGHKPQEEEQAYADLLNDANLLRAVMDGFLTCSTQTKLITESSDSVTVEQGEPNESHGSDMDNQSSPTPTDMPMDVFEKQLTLTIGQCRSRRQPVSLLLIEISGKGSNDVPARSLFEQILNKAIRLIDKSDVICETMGPCRRVMVLPSCERHEAVRLAEEMISQIEQITQRMVDGGILSETIVRAGVSSVELPPKNFPPQDLLETAERCLSAAQSSGTNTVKSLEIY